MEDKGLAVVNDWTGLIDLAEWTITVDGGRITRVRKRSEADLECVEKRS